MRSIPNNKSYQAKLHYLKGKLENNQWVDVPGVREFEHYRFRYTSVDPKHAHKECSTMSRKCKGGRESYMHIATVVMVDGSVHVGVARPIYYDVYSRKVGFAISTGRALEKVLRRARLSSYGFLPQFDFKVSSDLRGVELRDACRKGVIPIVDEMAKEIGFDWGVDSHYAIGDSSGKVVSLLPRTAGVTAASESAEGSITSPQLQDGGNGTGEPTSE